MVKRAFFVLMVGLFIQAYAAFGNSEKEEEINLVFQQYRLALLNDNGTKALEVIDSLTVRYYDNVVKDALKLSRSDLVRLNLYTRFIVLRIRHEFRKDQLEKMTGDSLFVLSIEQGWISKSEVTNNSKLGNIKFDRNLASASLPQAPEVPVFYFIKENSKWKLALWKIFDLANTAFSQMLMQSGLGEDEFVIRILSNISNNPVDERIFEGPLE